MTPPSGTAAPAATSSRLPGAIGLVAGAIGVVAGLVLILYPAAVDEDQYSYPFGATGFAISQIVLLVRDLGLAILLASLWSSGAIGRSRLGRVGVAGSVLAMVALAVLEAVSIIAEDDIDVGAAYGLASFAIGLFAVLAGIAVLRAKIWTGRRRYLPLSLGVYVFVPMTPGILAGYVVEQLVIAGWMVLFAVLGWVQVNAATRTAP
ncbi:hypothetical protein [Jiangella anatolica]|uniref:DUF998 domain-containing protein n=1 Tax=Jiangella anatolica TaxID=2670374 RepID=A0A2W2AX59_9ACTN|nr:hypothetical protein [Jiangella anatolica]PZF79751.1 hypothetical protein C1I92_29660 [Jiangella anatolica]